MKKTSSAKRTLKQTKRAFGPVALAKWVLRTIGLAGLLLAAAAATVGYLLGGQKVREEWNIYDKDL